MNKHQFVGLDKIGLLLIQIRMHCVCRTRKLRSVTRSLMLRLLLDTPEKRDKDRSDDHDKQMFVIALCCRQRLVGKQARRKHCLLQQKLQRIDHWAGSSNQTLAQEKGPASPASDRDLQLAVANEEGFSRSLFSRID